MDTTDYIALKKILHKISMLIRILDRKPSSFPTLKYQDNISPIKNLRFKNIFLQ